MMQKHHIAAWMPFNANVLVSKFKALFRTTSNNILRALLVGLMFCVSPAYALEINELGKITAPDGAIADFFGRAVAVSEDIVVVGSLFDDDNGPDSGSVYIFRPNSDGQWYVENKLTASDGANAEYFGAAVAIWGDTLVIGAWLDDPMGMNSGSAYIFQRNGDGLWNEEVKLLPSDGAISDYFGRSVAISDSIVVIGAYENDDNGKNSGSAYVFTKDDNGDWYEQGKLTADDGAYGDGFGRTVAVDGTTVVIGALYDDGTWDNSGSAYIFTRDNNSQWYQHAKLTATDGSLGDYLGFSVGVSGDIVVVSSHYDDDNGSASGSAYLFSPGLNEPPTADAGENITIASSEQCMTAIQGTAADPDGDPLQYQWVENGVELMSWSPVGPNGEALYDICAHTPGLTLGQHILSLRVSDDKMTTTDEMILTIGNSAPNAAPSGAGSYPIGTTVTVGGEVSDFDGDPVDYTWSTNGTTYCTGVIQTQLGGVPVNLPVCDLYNLELGSHALTLSISDGVNDVVTKVIVVDMVDTTAPTLAPASNTSILWPPNHKMHDIVINAHASDNSGIPPQLSVTVTSNEPENGLGDSDASPDWTLPVIDQLTGVIMLQLRAERSGTGNGRIYAVIVTAVDLTGNTTVAEVEIITPHDKRKSK